MSTRWRVGEIIAERWEVQQVIAGGMGVVYVVHDRATHEKMAAKSYREDLLNSEVTARFTNEAKTWINIPPHPNIVRAKSYKIIEQTPLLFLELAEDGTLQERLQGLDVLRGHDRLVSRFDRMVAEYARLSTMRNFAIQFCDGMIHAQKHGVVAHRDIKPANCLFHKGVLKISDFGLAKSLDAADHVCVHASRRRLRAMLVGWFWSDLKQLSSFLASYAYDAVVAQTSEGLLQRLADHSFDLVLVEDRGAHLRQ